MTANYPLANSHIVYRSLNSTSAFPSQLPSSSQHPARKSLVEASFRSQLDTLRVLYCCPSTTTYICESRAKDGPEKCTFSISFPPESETETVNRLSGCCFLFRRVVAELFGQTVSSSSCPFRMFRPLPLPREFNTNVHHEDDCAARLNRMQHESSMFVEQQEQFVSALKGWLFQNQHAEMCCALLQQCQND